MQDAAGNAIVTRIVMAHALLLKATVPLDESDFSRRFGATAPPIGWHLWHVARSGGPCAGKLAPRKRRRGLSTESEPWALGAGGIDC